MNSTHLSKKKIKELSRDCQHNDKSTCKLKYDCKTCETIRILAKRCTQLSLQLADYDNCFHHLRFLLEIDSYRHF